MTDSTLRRRYFGVLLIAQVLVYGWLLFSHRLPRGHDSLSVFLLQYLFLAQPGSGAGVALWMPQLAHGVTSAWFANLQTGLLQNVLLLFGGLPEGTPMLPVYYAGLFLEDLVLLLGVWKLGARFYRSPSAQFFVAAAALGSSMWASNLFWSHRLIYGVPLLISLLLEFIETGKRARLLFAASLGSLLILGNAAYIPVMSGFAAVLFLTLHLRIHRKQLRSALPLLRPRPSDLLWIAAIVLVVAASVTAVLADLGSIRQYQRGRNPDGSVTLDSFLSYPGGMNPLRYADLILGLNVSADFSLYAGICTLLLAFRAFTRRPRKEVLVLGITLLILLLFSLGFLGGVGMAGYEAIPPLRYFRYVGLTCVLVKLFVILLSGFGFDALVRAQRSSASPGGHGHLRFGLVAAGLLTVQLLFRALRGPGCSDAVSSFLKKIQGNIAERQPQGGPGIELVFLLLVAGAGLLEALRRRRGGNLAFIVPLVLALHGIDLLGWRIQILREATLPLAAEQRATIRIGRIPYAVRRTPSDEGNPRAAAFGRDILKLNDLASGMMYDYGDALLHRDASWSAGFVTLWSPPPGSPPARARRTLTGLRPGSAASVSRQRSPAPDRSGGIRPSHRGKRRQAPGLRRGASRAKR